MSLFCCKIRLFRILVWTRSRLQEIVHISCKNCACITQMHSLLQLPSSCAFDIMYDSHLVDTWSPHTCRYQLPVYVRFAGQPPWSYRCGSHQHQIRKCPKPATFQRCCQCGSPHRVHQYRPKIEKEFSISTEPIVQ